MTQLILADDTALPNKINLQLSKVLSIAKASSESLRDIVWFINPSHDGFNNLIMKINNMARTQLVGIKVTISKIPTINKINTDISFNRHYFLIFKEIIQNIIKHSKADTVKIRWELANKKCVLRIIDNGVGFEIEKNKEMGSGLRNMYRRAEIIEVNLKIDSELNKGTTIELSYKIP